MGKTIHQDERGLGVVVILLVILVVAAVGGAGYYVMSKNKDKDASDTANSVSNAALEAECKQEIDDKDFCKFVSNVNFDESYKSTISSTSTEGSSTMMIEVDKDGNSRTVTSTNGQEVAAFVSIGNTSYIKDMTDGQWTKYTSEQTEEDKDTNISDNLDFEFDEGETAPDKIEYKKIGKEACGSLSCFKYQIIDPQMNPGDSSFVWFDDVDYKLRRYQFTNSDGTTDITYSYESVTISEPSPIKEAPDYSNMTPEQLQAAMEAAMQAAGAE